MQVCISLQIDNHASTAQFFLQAGCPSCRPTNSVKALKAKKQPKIKIKLNIHTTVDVNISIHKNLYNQ